MKLEWRDRRQAPGETRECCSSRVTVLGSQKGTVVEYFKCGAGTLLDTDGGWRGMCSVGSGGEADSGESWEYVGGCGCGHV
jgi:hypothetical protein